MTAPRRFFQRTVATESKKELSELNGPNLLIVLARLEKEANDEVHGRFGDEESSGVRAAVGIIRAAFFPKYRYANQGRDSREGEMVREMLQEADPEREEVERDQELAYTREREGADETAAMEEPNQEPQETSDAEIDPERYGEN